MDRDKVLKQGLDLGEVYKTLQTFMGGYFVNYFNRFGRQWQVYVEADDKYRSSLDNIGLFYVRNRLGQSVPLSAVTKVERRTGPEFVMHYNEYRCAQINGSAAPGYSSDQATKALEEVFAKTMPAGMGFDYFGMSFQEQQAAKGVPRIAIFGLVAGFCVSDPGRALRKLVAAFQRLDQHAGGRAGRFSGPCGRAISRTMSMCKSASSC